MSEVTNEVNETEVAVDNTVNNVENDVAAVPVDAADQVVELEEEKLVGEEKAFALMEIQALTGMMGCTYEKPNMRNKGPGQPAEFKGSYTTVNIYELTEVIAMKERCDELCAKLGISLKMKK